MNKAFFLTAVVARAAIYLASTIMCAHIKPTLNGPTQHPILCAHIKPTPNGPTQHPIHFLHTNTKLLSSNIPRT